MPGPSTMPAHRLALGHGPGSRLHLTLPSGVNPCLPALDPAPGDQPALGVALLDGHASCSRSRPLETRVPVSEAAAVSGVFPFVRHSSLLCVGSKRGDCSLNWLLCLGGRPW